MIGNNQGSKWGLEGFSQALVQETELYDTYVTLVEMGGVDTD